MINKMTVMIPSENSTAGNNSPNIVLTKKLYSIDLAFDIITTDKNKYITVRHNNSSVILLVPHN